MNNYSSVRVGVAGVTGYAGLELMRRLARHPHADVKFAMASSASESKRMPALARIWDAPVEPLDIDKLAAETDAVFLALPDALAAEIAPTLADRGTCVRPVRGLQAAGLDAPQALVSPYGFDFCPYCLWPD
jgi:N-acetyl-gamma-glutamyl-phosphate reductase